MTSKPTIASAQPYQQLMVLFSSYVVALREQEFSEESQMRILAKTTSALTQIYTAEVLSKPRKRQGVYRAASTPPAASKKVPADQRVQFSPEEVKRLNHLNQQIGSKLYSGGITIEQFLNSLAKDGRAATLPNLKAGLFKLKLNFSSEDMELLLRKYNALLDVNGRINYNEFSHLFPKRQLDQLEEDMKEETEATPTVTAERKDRGKPTRALTSNPFPQTMQLPDEDDAEISKRLQDQDMSDDDDLEEEPGQTPPRDTDES